MAAKTPRTLWDKIFAAVRNDPKRAGILTVLISILVVLQVRLQMNDKDGGPSHANANAAPGAANNSSAPGTGSDGLLAPAKPMDSATALRVWMDSPGAPLTRNLFAVQLDKFPHDGSPVQTTNKDVVGFWDELAKSMTSRADVRKERRVLVENLARQASQLRLQSTIMGASPKAVIDGDLVGEGDVVATFRVLRIEPRRIIVEREGIKLEIQMK
ncbi:MAG: hypothetical protein QOF78_934 [Phycisphaerales bacterium]|jgi:hypothetical protein|nr:hypothetical protein [Phycisphaerales bacterium]